MKSGLCRRKKGSMKLAVTIWENRISPVADPAKEVLAME